MQATGGRGKKTTMKHESNEKRIQTKHESNEKRK